MDKLHTDVVVNPKKIHDLVTKSTKTLREKMIKPAHTQHWNAESYK